MGQRTAKSHRVLIKRTILALMGGCCYLYSVFGSDFAELHVRVPQLDFPIFVGEILLLGCLLLLGPVYFKSRPLWGQRGGMIVGFYAAWLLIKAFGGYWVGGPLAFRNAALFYYPFFAVIGFLIYDPRFFSGKILSCLFFFLAANLMIIPVNDYYVFAYGMMTLVLGLKIKSPWVKIMATGVVVFQFFFTKVIGHGSRSHMIGIGLAVIFLAGYFFFGLLKLRWRTKLLGAAFVVGLFIFCVSKFSDPNARQSLLTLGHIPEKFRELDRAIARKREGFVREQLGSGVYHENSDNVMRGLVQDHLNLAEQIKTLPFADIGFGQSRNTFQDQGEMIPALQPATAQTVPRDIVAMKKEPAAESAPSEVRPKSAGISSFGSGVQTVSRDVAAMEKEPAAESVPFEVRPKSAGIPFSNSASVFTKINGFVTERLNIPPPRSLEVANNNILFRLFIWRDMMEDLKKKRAWLSGVGFEYPQRSPSIEILDWATTEWRRDGWITPHNSFLHMIYRGGVVGAVFVGALFTSLVYFTRRFLYLKSVEGGLLMAILLYWLGLANFLVILELPYSAIPFWSLFGMIAAYLKRLENRHRTGLQVPNL